MRKSQVIITKTKVEPKTKHTQRFKIVKLMRKIQELQELINCTTDQKQHEKLLQKINNKKLRLKELEMELNQMK